MRAERTQNSGMAVSLIFSTVYPAIAYNPFLPGLRSPIGGRSRSVALVSPGAGLLAGVDLATRWQQLVSEGAIVATTRVPSLKKDISYGVRLKGENNFEDFVIGDANLNATLEAGQAGRLVYDGCFVASLQLVRTLRPPPTPGLTEMPPYNRSTDSFVTGPLRLQLRPRAASILVESSGRTWDCYHNVSPCDIRGHFLLLPTIDVKGNWRRQQLTAKDCVDLVWMGRASKTVDASVPPWLITFNSVRAGASQNHIHCHVWRNPPLPLAARNLRYAVLDAEARKDVLPIRLDSGVEIALLEYPCLTVRIRGGDDLLAGSALAKVVEVVEGLGCSYNVGVLGKDVWVFVRSPSGERAPQLPSHKLGASEMMGHFHCGSLEQMDLVANPGFMEDALSAVSADASHVWQTLAASLKPQGV